MLTLLDTIDLLGVPLHATCLGRLSGALVTLLAVADHRIAGANSVVTLREPRTQIHGSATDVSTQAEQHRRRLRQTQQRLAAASHHPVETVIDDMRAGRVVTAEEARDYGLIDTITSQSAVAVPTRPRGARRTDRPSGLGGNPARW